MSEQPYICPKSISMQLGHLSLFELQITTLIYYVYQLYRSQTISLPCASYVVASMIDDFSVLTGDEKSMTVPPLSDERILQEIAAIHKQVDRLSRLYASEVFKNVYLIRWVSTHIEKQYQTVTLRQLAKDLHINSSYLSSAISDNTGCSFRDIVFYRRIFAFVELALDHSADVLEQILQELGYNSIHHFSKIVKHHLKLSPSLLRRNILLFSGMEQAFPILHA